MDRWICDVGHIYVYHVPWRWDLIQKVGEVFEEARRELKRLEARQKPKTKAETKGWSS